MLCLAIKFKLCSNVHRPSFEKGDVDNGGKVVDKLKGKQFDGDTIVIFTLSTKTFPVCEPECKVAIDLKRLF